MDGEAPLPFEHYIGRLSEEFGGALPSAIWAERQRLPAGFMEQILEYRRYAEAKRANDVDPKGWSGSELRALAFTIEMEIAQESAGG